MPDSPVDIWRNADQPKPEGIQSDVSDNRVPMVKENLFESNPAEPTAIIKAKRREKRRDRECLARIRFIEILNQHVFLSEEGNKTGAPRIDKGMEGVQFKET